tara:strand:- start:90 stop:458 length:369 start_codon:yes stop_codon:yes gene_type:complete
MENAKFHDIFGKTQVSFKEIPYYETQDASGMPIFPEGCSITTEEFKIRYDEVEKDYSINKLRIERNVLLAESDWTQVLDVSLSNMDEWKAYRQVLRDLPQTQPNITTDLAGNIIDNIFPEKP